MRKVTLTFDNGPDPDVTPAVLATLRKHDVLSTFFVLGDKLRDRRRFAERAHAEGHWIGNHTYNHLVPLGLSGEPGAALYEIERTQALIADLAHPRRLFRPLGGGGIINDQLLNQEAADYLSDHRFTCVLWNVVPQDWVYPEGWVERALAMCATHEESCVVLHDLPTGAMKLLDSFIATLRENAVAIVQNFPASCVVLERGEPRLPLERYLNPPPRPVVRPMEI